MADKRIQDLTPASSVQTSDRFVLEQSGQAKSLTGQILINDLAAFLDGHGGINDISYTPPSTGSLNGTLTITLADETVETFTVTNGRGIESIGFVESIGLDDYYEITYNDDANPTTFIVHNGEKGDTGDDWYVHIKWAAVMPTQDSDMVNYPDDFIGIYSGTSSAAPTSYGEYDWYEYKGEKGDTGTGITGVALESSSGLVDTYRVSFDDGTSTTFNVTNGSQIDSITKTSTVGLVDTYTVSLTNGNQTTFQVNNGKSIVSITWTSTTSPTGVPHVPGATDTYTVAYNDGDSTTFQVYNGLDGEGASLTVDGIPSVNGNVPLLTIDTEHGAPTPQTVGSPKSRYFDAINSVLYICLGYDENNGYIWRGAGVTVDSALSTSSTNPVQNRVVTNKIGTAALDTTAQDLSGAVNEILDDISGFADNLADEYDPTATYAVGDLCLHNNTLYRCNTAIATPEAWNSIHWTATSVDEELDGKVSKSGDTMTGELRINNNNFVIKNSVADITAASISAQQNNWYRVYDKNGETIANFDGVQETNGRTAARLFARNLGSGSQVDNLLQLSVNSSGVQGVYVTAPEAWRSAIGLGTSGAFPITISQGGTGATTAANAKENLGLGNATNNLQFNNLSTSGQIASFSFKSNNSGSQFNNHALTFALTDTGLFLWDATSGVSRWSLQTPISIAYGGTGQTGNYTSTTVSTFATAGSNVQITGGNFAKWGKVAQMRLVIKPSANIAAGAVIATLKSGAYPSMVTSGFDTLGAKSFWLSAVNYQIITNSALTSGTSYTYAFTYILSDTQ